MTSSNQPQPFDPSFPEKSAWACLISTLVVFGAFFSTVFWLPAVAPPAPFFAGAVVVHAGMTALIHIVLAARDVPGAEAKADERDKAINLQAHRVSSWILSIGVILIVLGLYAIDLVGRESPSAPTLGMVGNVLLACFVLSESAFYLTQGILYRRGV